MEFQFIVVSVALIILVILLIIVYFRLQTKDTKFPAALTNCPDYWKINPENGNCIIPSKDDPKANLGNLANKNKGTPIYVYNFEGNLLTSSVKIIDTENGPVKGMPYKKDGYTVYAYNLNSEPASYDIPVGYYKLPTNYNKLSEADKLKAQQNNLFKPIIEKGNEINFNKIEWSAHDEGGASICQIKKWANKNNIVWDGLDSYNQC